MEGPTFRQWLMDRGCRFDTHQHLHRPHGPVTVTVHRDGRTTELPLGGSHEELDWDLVCRACEDLGLDWRELPGPQSRV